MRKAILLLLVCAGASLGQFRTTTDSAMNRNESDLFFKGFLLTAQGENTVYSWDIKVRYPIFRHLLSSQRRWRLEHSPLFDFVASQGNDANPDKVKTGYEFVLIHAPRPVVPGERMRRTERILRTRDYVVQVTGEFDRKFATRSFVPAVFVRQQFGNAFKDTLRTYAEAGVEVGNNHVNKLQEEGSGLVRRLYAGIFVGQKLGSYLRLVGTYQYRGPFRQEVYTAEINGTVRTILTAKPRHFSEAGFEFPLWSKFSFAPTYRWGSLPPSFNHLDHQVTLTLEYKKRVQRPTM